MFATLWLKGVVILTLGASDMNLEHCQTMKKVMEADIITSFSTTPDLLELLPKDTTVKDFKVTCSTQELPIGYMNE